MRTRQETVNRYTTELVDSGLVHPNHRELVSRYLAMMHSEAMLYGAETLRERGPEGLKAEVLEAFKASGVPTT